MSRPLNSTWSGRIRGLQYLQRPARLQSTHASCHRTKRKHREQLRTRCAAAPVTEEQKQNTQQDSDEEAARSQNLKGLQTPAAVWLPNATEPSQVPHPHQFRLAMLCVRMQSFTICHSRSRSSHNLTYGNCFGDTWRRMICSSVCIRDSHAMQKCFSVKQTSISTMMTGYQCIGIQFQPHGTMYGEGQFPKLKWVQFQDELVQAGFVRHQAQAQS